MASPWVPALPEPPTPPPPSPPAPPPAPPPRPAPNPPVPAPRPPPAGPSATAAAGVVAENLAVGHGERAEVRDAAAVRAGSPEPPGAVAPVVACDSGAGVPVAAVATGACGVLHDHDVAQHQRRAIQDSTARRTRVAVATLDALAGEAGKPCLVVAGRAVGRMSAGDLEVLDGDVGVRLDVEDAVGMRERTRVDGRAGGAGADDRHAVQGAGARYVEI